jgi:glycosyltransferase involved in cell wall biosynthesis
VTRSEENQPLVSVVTPVYNASEYLSECIESVLNQTYRSWEHVIVNNCSTDGSLEIAGSYGERDKRIRVVAADEFVGLAENANRALREMSPSAKYCKVLHADDWLFPECLERMVELAESYPNVGVVSAYRLEEANVTLQGIPYGTSVVRGRDVARSQLLGGPYPYLFGSPTSVLIRSDLIRNREPFYNVENRFQHDQEALYDVLRESDFGFIHQVLTFTRRPDTAGTAYWTGVGAGLPGQIDLFFKFGPVYLDKAEYQRRLAVLMVEYALSLLGNLPGVADADFRSYQLQAARRFLDRVDWADFVAGVRLQLRRMLDARRLRPGAAGGPSRSI